VAHYVFVASAGAYNLSPIEPMHVEGDPRKSSAGHVAVEKYLEEQASPLLHCCLAPVLQAACAVVGAAPAWRTRCEAHCPSRGCVRAARQVPQQCLSSAECSRPVPLAGGVVTIALPGLGGRVTRGADGLQWATQDTPGAYYTVACMSSLWSQRDAQSLACAAGLAVHSVPAAVHLRPAHRQGLRAVVHGPHPARPPRAHPRARRAAHHADARGRCGLHAGQGARPHTFAPTCTLLARFSRSSHDTHLHPSRAVLALCTPLALCTRCCASRALSALLRLRGKAARELVAGPAQVPGNKAAVGQQFNVCSDRCITFDGIARAVGAAAGKRAEIVHYDAGAVGLKKGEGWPFRTTHFYASAEKAKRELGWQPAHKFLDDLPELVDAFEAAGRLQKDVDFTVDDRILEAVGAKSMATA